MHWLVAACVVLAGNAIEGDVGQAGEASRALSRRQLGELEKGYKTQLARDPANAALYDRLGYVYWRQGRLEASRSMFEESLRIHPQQPQTRLRLAAALRASGDVRRALTEVERALVLDDGIADAHALRGRLLRDLGQSREAWKSLEHAWQMSPPSVAAGVMLAEWEAARGDETVALDRLRVCLILREHDAKIRLAYARLLTQAGKADAAIEQWEILTKSGETGPEGFYQLADLYHVVGKPQRAEECRNQAARLGGTRNSLPATAENTWRSASYQPLTLPARSP